MPTACPIIIGGFYRSGTSLLRRILDSHSRISCGPEVKFLKDLHADYPRDDLAHVRFFKTALSLGITESELLAIFGRAFIACHELAAKKLDKVRWADKNPENVLYLDDWQQLLPDGFIFIHVLRNPYDALASLKEVGFPKAVPADFEGKVALYATYVTRGLAYSREHPDSTITIVYEDLVRQPRRTLVDLFARLGEPFEEQVLTRFHLEERRSGIEDTKVLDRPDIHAESIGRGGKDLTREERQVVRTMLAALPVTSSGEWQLEW